MKILKTSLLLLSLMYIIGCEVSGPSVKVEPPKVKVDGVKVEGTQSKGDFCPPGQAKKGNC